MKRRELSPMYRSFSFAQRPLSVDQGDCVLEFVHVTGSLVESGLDFAKVDRNFTWIS
jgi:hypothetical protein